MMLFVLTLLSVFFVACEPEVITKEETIVREVQVPMEAVPESVAAEEEPTDEAEDIIVVTEEEEEEENEEEPVEELDCDPVTIDCLNLTKLSTQDKPADFYTKVETYGTRITMEDQKCNWAIRPEIFVFQDGVLYTARNVDAYQYFSINDVHRMGCTIPNFQNPYRNELELEYPGDDSTLAELNYDIETEGARNRPETFIEDVKKGRKVTQENFSCNWAVSPLIYVFPDGIIFTVTQSGTYSFFKRETAIAMGCQID